MSELGKKTALYLEAIKVSHSVFALPFALAAAFMAAEGLPEPRLLLQVALACVFARTAAMSFNRLADATLDVRNPRTAQRALPAGRLSRKFMATATLLSAAAFVATAAWINDLALALSPVVLLVLLGYSYTKRFTSLSHLALGAALGLSPLGAWVAVRAEVSLASVLLGLAVLFWTAGFDVIYACQDVDFDRRADLRSIPSRLGIARALLLSRACHLLAVGALLASGWEARFGLPYYAAVAVVAALLAWEQSLVSASDLSRVNVAFFTINGLVSVLFLCGVIVQVVI